MASSARRAAASRSSSHASVRNPAKAREHYRRPSIRRSGNRYVRRMQEIGRGAKVFDAAPVRGRFLPMEGPDDVLALMDTGADGVVALVRDAGATFLAPIYHELTGDHLHERHAAQPHRHRRAASSRCPCVMGCAFSGDEPAAGTRGRARLLRRRGGRPWLTTRRRSRRPTGSSPTTRRSPGRSPQERTSLESALIPVTAYIVVACAESYLRYPEMMERIDAAMPAEEIGRRARRPGCQVDPCYLWSIANFFLLGRKIMAMVDPRGRRPGAHRHGPRLLGAGRARLPRRRHPPGVGHGHVAHLRRRHRRGAARRRGADRRRRPPSRGEAVQRHARQPPVPPLLRHARRLRRHRARTRCPGHPGRSLLVRDFYRLAHGDFPWSDVAKDVPVPPPHGGARARRRAEHLHRLRHVEPHARGLPRPPRRLRPLHHRRPAARRAAAGAGRRARRHRRRRAQGAGPALPQHRGHGPRREDPRRRLRVLHASSGPFAEIAGVADELDWTVPRDLPEPLYQLLSAMQGDNASVPDDVAVLRPLPGGRTA